MELWGLGHGINISLSLCHGLGLLHGHRIVLAHGIGLRHGHHIGLGHVLGLVMSRSSYVYV
jgi:hypothetical protein